MILSDQIWQWIFEILWSASFTTALCDLAGDSLRCTESVLSCIDRSLVTRL